MRWGRSRRGSQRRGKGVLDAREQGGDEGVRRLIVLVLFGEGVERGQAWDIVRSVETRPGWGGGSKMRNSW